MRSPGSFFVTEKPQVLVVGTFHFNYPGLDAHKTAEDDKIDVLSPTKQREVRELIEYIKQFNPNKIAVENRPDNSTITSTLKAYKQGEVELNRSEHQQIAVRIAAETGLDTIYSIDAPGMISSMETVAPEFVEEMALDYDFKSEGPYYDRYLDLVQYADQLIKERSLLEVFKWMNTPEYHRYDYGAYLIGDFKLGEFRGADMLSSYWYNRNLRIFRNIQQITESKNDRILVIFGNGHASILRQVLESSPEYEFVEFGSLGEVGSRQ